MTRTEQQAMADKMIGAAQLLDKLARQLKEQAKLVRQGALHQSITADLWRMHKVGDIERTATSALAELA